MAQYFSSAERKEPRIPYSVKIFLRNKENIKTFMEKGQLREFVTSRPTQKNYYDCLSRKSQEIYKELPK